MNRSDSFRINTHRTGKSNSETPVQLKVKVPSIANVSADNRVASKHPVSKQCSQSSTRDRTCTIIQQQVSIAPYTFDQVFDMASNEGFDKKTISTGYKNFKLTPYGYTYEAMSENSIHKNIANLSKLYLGYKEFNLIFAWQNACHFETYVLHNREILTNTHVEILKTLTSAQSKDGFQPLRWIQKINDVLQADPTHKVAKLAGLWVDFSILIALDSDTTGLTNKRRLRLQNPRRNADIFNWRRVPPSISYDKQPEIISTCPVESSLSPGPESTETSNNESPDCNGRLNSKQTTKYRLKARCKKSITCSSVKHKSYMECQIHLNKMTIQEIKNYTKKINDNINSNNLTDKSNNKATKSVSPKSSQVTHNPGDGLNLTTVRVKTKNTGTNTDNPQIKNQDTPIEIGTLELKNQRLLTNNIKLRQKCTKLKKYKNRLKYSQQQLQSHQNEIKRLRLLLKKKNEHKPCETVSCHINGSAPSKTHNASKKKSSVKPVINLNYKSPSPQKPRLQMQSLSRQAQSEINIFPEEAQAITSLSDPELTEELSFNYSDILNPVSAHPERSRRIVGTMHKAGVDTLRQAQDERGFETQEYANYIGTITEPVVAVNNVLTKAGDQITKFMPNSLDSVNPGNHDNFTGTRDIITESMEDNVWDNPEAEAEIRGIINNDPLPLIHSPINTPVSCTLFDECGSNFAGINFISNRHDEGYNSWLNDCRLASGNSDNELFPAHFTITTWPGFPPINDGLAGDGDHERHKTQPLLNQHQPPATNTHKSPVKSTLAPGPLISWLPSSTYADDWDFLWEQGSNPIPQADSDPMAPDRETDINGMPTSGHWPETQLTELQPVPFSLHALKNNQDAFQHRAANALKVSVKQLEMIDKGAGGVVFKCSYSDQATSDQATSDQTTEAVKFHFDHNNPDRPPHEITVLNDLSTAQHKETSTIEAYLPDYKETRFCHPEKVWMHRMRFYPASLHKLLTSWPNGIPEPLARQFTSDILNGLAELNRLAYMHRDIKPENLLLKPSFWQIWNSADDAVARDLPELPLLVIADFGLAKQIKDPDEGRHSPNIATYQYRPAYTKDGNYDCSIDVSSTGMVFFQLITGKRFIEINPMRRPEHETPQARKLRKINDQQILEKTISQRLTGGPAFQTYVRRNCIQDWLAFFKNTQSRGDEYPIGQYCGLFYEVYGCDHWQGYLKEPATIPPEKLSPQGFIALCDLLTSSKEKDRVFSKPDRAEVQLSKAYWRNLPEISKVLGNIKPELRLFKAPQISTMDTATTAISNLSNLANEVEALFSEQERELDFQEELENWEETPNMNYPHCNRKFLNTRGWKRHLNYMHKSCPISGCEKIPDDMITLIRHIKSHSAVDQDDLKNRLYKIKDKAPGRKTDNKILKKLADCTCWYPVNKFLCGKLFYTKSLRQTHQLIHTGERPYKCELCGKAFNQSASLKSHQLIHTGERPYECELCGKAFNQSASLKNHQLFHTGERPHKCELCGKAFNQRAHLKSHQLIHTRERHYECELCGKAFNQRANLKSHQLIHTGERPYKCELCGKAFNQSANCKRHQITHTEKPGSEKPGSGLSSKTGKPGSYMVRPAMQGKVFDNDVKE